LAAYRAKAKGIEKAILDVGTRPVSTGSRLYAAMSGAVDSGMEIPHGEKTILAKERLRGEHIAAYGKLLSEKPDVYQKRFSAYLKQKLKPEDVPAHFDEVSDKMAHSFEKKA
jgi:large subunit ribosomal protein L18